MDAVELGRLLQRRRAVAGRTIAAVAAEAGLSVPYIANLEKGRGNPTLAVLARLSAALGLQLNVSVAGDDTRRDAIEGAEVDRLLGSERGRSQIAAIAKTGARKALVAPGLRAALLALQEVKGAPPSERDLDRLADAFFLAREG